MNISDERHYLSNVMPGLVPGIHVLLWGAAKAWMPATSAGMTTL
jgi:hypothetical protein